MFSRRLVVLAALLVACSAQFTGHSGSAPQRQPWGRPSNSQGQGRPWQPSNKTGCGGYKQLCCNNSQCGSGLSCLTNGDSSWVGVQKRCLRPKVRGKCGLEGLQCCEGRCISGLSCAMGRMCRKPQDEVEVEVDPNVVGQTTAVLNGWLKIMVRAHGGKCYVRINGNLETSVTTFGDGTFGETFGDLSGLGECEEGASGYGVGYIKADVLLKATLDADGNCTSEGTTDVNSGATIRGDGITIGVGGNVGGSVGCNKRRMLKEFLS